MGRDALREAPGVHAVTDVTGFGLAGHASEMAEGSGLTIRLKIPRSLPRLEGIEAIARRSLPHPRQPRPTAISSTAAS